MLKIIAPLIVIVIAAVFIQSDFDVAIEQSTDESNTASHTRVMNPELDTDLSQSASSAGYIHPGSEENRSGNPADSLNSDAIESLREARIHGDDRTPKLNKTRERDELPTPAQIEDPELYQEYERRQQNRVYRAYVEASKIKTAEIRNMIERGKQEGISDQEIQFAEDKIKGIEDMAAQLQRDHPEIMQDDFKPADDWLINNLGVADPEQEKDSTANSGDNQ